MKLIHTAVTVLVLGATGIVTANAASFPGQPAPMVFADASQTSGQTDSASSSAQHSEAVSVSRDGSAANSPHHQKTSSTDKCNGVQGDLYVKCRIYSPNPKPDSAD
jgi:hypothetical protein